MKTKNIKKALLKQLEIPTLSKVNESVYLSVRMRSPVINPHPVYGSWFPVFDVPVDEIEARLAEGYSFVIREPKKDANTTDGQPRR
jgi:hypothetical protein